MVLGMGGGGVGWGGGGGGGVGGYADRLQRQRGGVLPMLYLDGTPHPLPSFLPYPHT